MEKVTYKVVEECITRLSRLYQQHQDDLEAGLFSQEAVALRHRLKTSLVKVIFLTPADFGARGEELLWRKVFYEVLAQVKKCRASSGRRLTQRVEALYRCHLLSGLGFYQQLMARVLIEYPHPDAPLSPLTPESHSDGFGGGSGGVVGSLDFAPGPEQNRHCRSIGDVGGGDEAVAEWARAAVHRCLLHIGDLYRYLREYKGEVALALVQRYYAGAARFDPRIGLPYNQLGTLDLGSYYNLTAVYYYLRCLACEQPFEGSRRNLAAILRKNQRRFDSLPPPPEVAAAAAASSAVARPAKPVKQFAVRFLHLTAMLLQPQALHQQQRQRRHQHQHQQDAELSALCQSVLASLATCLQLTPTGQAAPAPAASTSGLLCVRASEVDPMRPHLLADSALMQASLAALMCLHALMAGNSRLAHACTAFCLGLFSCLLECAIARCRAAVQLSSVAATDTQQIPEGAGESAGDQGDDSTVEEVVDDDAGEDGGSENEVGAASGCQAGRSNNRDKAKRKAKEQEEEEEAGGDFPGFSAMSAPRRRRQRQQQQRRRRRTSDGGVGGVDSSASSSDASSEDQLAFGYGDEEEAEAEAEAERAGEDEAEAADGEEDAAAPTPAVAVLGTFCFSYGIPSALLPPAEDAPDEAEEEAAALGDLQFGSSSETVASPAIVPDADAANGGDDADESTTAAAAVAAAAKLQLLSRVRLLQTVKLLQDWMLCQPHLLSRAVQDSCLPLWDRLATLLNLLPASPGEDCGVLCPEPEAPSPALPEDAHVRGLPLFRPAQRHVDFTGRSGPAAPATRLEECRLRLAALRRFGFLAVQNDQLGFEFDPATRQFLGPTAVRRATRDGQMRSLAQLRLLGQVRQLETAVSRAAPAFTASHAVPSYQCLLEALDQVQSLVRSRRCVLVLPRSSIDHLDRLKRSSQAARRASRYLEGELQAGRSLINAHEYPTLTACAAQLNPRTSVFLICRGEAPPPDLPFPTRDIFEFARQAAAAAGKPT